MTLFPWLLGCVPVFGRMEAAILPLPDPGFYNPWYWVALGLLVGGLAIRLRLAFVAPRLSGPAWIRNTLGIAAIQGMASWTFLGGWGYLLLSGFHDFGPAGAAMLIGVSFLLGLAPGLVGLFPLMLYGIYHDLFLLQAAAIPALGAAVVEGLYLSAKLSHLARLQQIDA